MDLAWEGAVVVLLLRAREDLLQMEVAAAAAVVFLMASRTKAWFVICIFPVDPGNWLYRNVNLRPVCS